MKFGIIPGYYAAPVATADYATGLAQLSEELGASTRGHSRIATIIHPPVDPDLVHARRGRDELPEPGSVSVGIGVGVVSRLDHRQIDEILR